ncbi:hypothetical protein ACFFIX_11420 [Metabacillus herbersteinensis]|uniref:Uncharacterized protein n=1 Tax=Metabacillus herbersteinensis TaxID=283816 RepID=A0ABV6GEF0_9BACI
MSGVIFLFFVISLLLFIGTFHYLKLIGQSAAYPPKKVLKQKATVLGTGGAISLLLGSLLYFFQ